MADGRREELLQALGSDWRRAELSPPDAVLCAFAEKLTRTPARSLREDLDRLRDAGLDDTAIHDATQVVAYFNYINRVADALRVDLEPEMDPYPE